MTCISFPYRPLVRVILITFLFGILWLQAPPSQAEEKPVDLSTAIVKVAKESLPAVVAIEVTER